MNVRTIALLVVLSLVATPVFADTPIRASAANAAAAAAAQMQRPAARGENPYLWPGIALMGGGGTLVMLGFLNQTGVECEDRSTSRSFSVQCNTTANKGLLFTGLGAAGVGGILLMMGEKRRNAPSLLPTAGGFVVSQRVRF